MLRLDKRGRFKPTPQYFEKLVAKAILFRSAEKLIGKQALGGYRSQTVTYTLAKLFNATGQRIDLQPIWRAQVLPGAVEDAIDTLAPRVHATLLRRPVAEHQRVRQEGGLLEGRGRYRVDTGRGAAGQLITDTGPRPRAVDSIGEVLTAEEEAARALVEEVPAATWFELAKWAKQTDNLQSWERSLAFTLGRNASSGKPPSRKQANHGARILAAARKLGFNPD